jgi:paraquat-inducible protein A
MTATVTARELGLTACHCCGLVSRAPDPAAGKAFCPRCETPLHARKPNSVARTWALLLAAGILYIPANLLPIMESGSLFGSQQDTIMSGVVFLATSGSWHLAALVFFASIVVPSAKLLALAFLLVSVQRSASASARSRTRMYRVLEFFGRWSMLDIYVVTLLAALVQIESIATIRPGPGALFFGIVVVLTMLAAMSFDPRLMWDKTKEPTRHD